MRAKTVFGSDTLIWHSLAAQSWVTNKWRSSDGQNFIEAWGEWQRVNAAADYSR